VVPGPKFCDKSGNEVVWVNILLQAG